MSPETQSLGLSAEELGAAVGDVLAGLGVAPFSPAQAAPSESSLSAGVTLHGSGEISMVVSAPESVAHALASAFFGIDDSALETVDVLDAVGELANICGGAIKPLLDGQWVIGVPNRELSRLPNSETTLQASVPVAGGHVLVAMAQLSPNQRTESAVRPTL